MDDALLVTGAEEYSSRLVSRYPSLIRKCPATLPDIIMLSTTTDSGRKYILSRIEKQIPRQKKRPKIKPPVSVESHMEHKKEQFFLRSLRRIERSEEEVLPFNRDLLEQTIVLASQIMPRRYERPQLLASFNIDEVLYWRRFMRSVFFEDDWTRRFGKELRESLSVAVWKYDPDAPEPEEE